MYASPCMCACAHIACKIAAANILPHDRRRAGPPWIPGRNLRTAPATFHYVYLVKGNTKLELNRRLEIGNAPRRDYNSLTVMARYNVFFSISLFLNHFYYILDARVHIHGREERGRPLFDPCLAPHFSMHACFPSQLCMNTRVVGESAWTCSAFED